MAPHPRRSDDVIDLTESPPTSPDPILSPRPVPNLPTRASINNPNQPVALPSFDGSAEFPQPSFREDVDLTTDEDQDEELKHAIALSLLSHQQEVARDVGKLTEDCYVLVDDDAVEKRNKEPQQQMPNGPIIHGNGAFGFLGLDRKAMEEERLARLKRKREGESRSSAESANSSAAAVKDGLPVSAKGNAVSAQDNNHKRVKASTEPVAVKGSAITREISPPAISKARTPSSSNLSTATRKPVPTDATSQHRNSNLRQISSSVTPPPSQNATSSRPKPRFYPTPTLLRTQSPLDSSHLSTTPSLPTTTLTSLLISPFTNSTTNLTSALLSSFTIDFDFLLPLFNTHSTNFVFILHASSAAHRNELEASFAGVSNVRLVFPPAVGGMAGCGTMHSKVSVLFYGPESGAGSIQKSTTEGEEFGDGDGDGDGDEHTQQQWKHGRCRILVPTGNLVAYDWGENGSAAPTAPAQARENAKINVENLVWVVDLPVLPSPNESMPAPPPGAADGKQKKKKKPANTKTTHFQNGLLAYLAAQAVPQGVLTKLQAVDFEATRDVGWVDSVAGFHFPHAVKQSAAAGAATLTSSADPAVGTGMGMYALSSTIRSLGLATAAAAVDNSEQEDVQVEFLTSSLGSLTNDWLALFYEAVCGRLGRPPKEMTIDTAVANDEKTEGNNDNTKRKKKIIVAMPAMPPPRTKGSADVDVDSDARRLTSTTTTTISQAHQSNLRIYYPTQHTVQHSLPGPRGAGTICFSDHWWDRVEFPRSSVRDAVSVALRGRGLMHAKIIAVRFARARTALVSAPPPLPLPDDDNDDDDEDDGLRKEGRGRRIVGGHGSGEPEQGKRKEKGKVLLGWCYIGSANCSESAWGRLSNTGKLTLRNWEAGVVMPIYADADSDPGPGPDPDIENHPQSHAAGAVAATADTRVDDLSQHHRRQRRHDDDDNDNDGADAIGSGNGSSHAARRHSKALHIVRSSSQIRPGDQVTLQDFLRALPLPMRVPGERVVEHGRRPWSGGGFGGFNPGNN